MEINSAFCLSFRVTCSEICVRELKEVGFFHLCGIYTSCSSYSGNESLLLSVPLFPSLFSLSLCFDSEMFHLHSRFQLLAVLVSNSSQSGTLLPPPSD